MGQQLLKFQNLLRDLFQFDSADLDFGIYRIMNFKRDIIEEFITEKLPEVISTELKQGALAKEAQLLKELEDAKKTIEDLSPDALDASGNLVKYQETNPGKEYLKLQERAKRAQDQKATELAIYNHLYTFFNRYWQDGDFISKRRFSKNERYAIPYNGEEVMLYWANHDQYYIKTGEYFTDYTWKATNGVSVGFKLVAADVEQDNVKGDKRFFLPQLDGVIWKESTKALTILFEYRPLTADEHKDYGTRNQQETIISKAISDVLAQKPVKDNSHALFALTEKRRRTKDNANVTALEHHLRSYTRRNTSDFFIHKDLKGFLSRELDFYLKNEVLNLDAMETAGEQLADGWFQMMRIMKNVGTAIIEFLTQIEEFQKMLWEKRKFITESFYCITVGNIPDEFYSEIAACKSQWDEWEELYRIEIEEEANLFTVSKDESDIRVDFLKLNPTLVLDTRHFSYKFTDRLLASYDDLDDKIDGLLVHSENWQALNLLKEKYKKTIECVHIDPPYNTQTSGFLYKNEYRHSSWLAMMQERMALVLEIMSMKGSFQCHIDENEYERLYILFDGIGFHQKGTLVWDKKNPMLGRKGIATQHEYVMWGSRKNEVIYIHHSNADSILKMAKSLIIKHDGVNEDARREFTSWINAQEDFTGGERSYRFIDDEGRVFQSVAMGAPEPRTDQKFFVPLIHPVTNKPCPVPSNGWSRAPETLQELLKRDEIIFGKDEATQPRRKFYLERGARRQMSSVISDSGRGKNDLEKLGLVFPYSHPVSLYEKLIGAISYEPDSIVLDYFAGSGTTGHAVINLNREDSGKRRFILVEMAEYFDTVLLPRIKKVTFSPEWQDGKPRRMATPEEAKNSPRIIKVIRLESYEDSLDNIIFDETGEQQTFQFDDYLLQYMLKWETRKSETLLNVKKMANPFSYKLHIHCNTDGAGGQTKSKVVDLPETFAYLLGLAIEKRLVLRDDDRRYLVHRGTTRDGRNTAVIWRKTEGWTEEDYKRDKEFLCQTEWIKDIDDIYVNGDSSIPGALAIEILFKERMFAPVEV